MEFPLTPGEELLLGVEVEVVEAEDEVRDEVRAEVEVELQPRFGVEVEVEVAAGVADAVVAVVAVDVVDVDDAVVARPVRAEHFGGDEVELGPEATGHPEEGWEML